MKTKPLKILVACEESQTVCKAFRKLGHEAYSNDLLPCSGGQPNWHLQMDVFKAAKLTDWDMMVGFPPCTHLAVSGAAWFAEKRKDGRQKKGIDFFMKVAKLPIKYKAIENPVSIMSTVWRKPDQIIQPWQFGNKAQKTTCLWLTNLPPLRPTNVVSKGKFFEYVDKQTGKLKRQPQWFADAFLIHGHNAELRQRIRSKTFQGVANAMAAQWSKYVILDKAKTKHFAVNLR